MCFPHIIRSLVIQLLHGILNRMLKKDDPERPEIERNLINIDTLKGVFGEFMSQYKHCTPQVHAEVQVLEHFYKENKAFVGNDRYIACSKPACLCCEMYFKYQPARMVVPESHRKVWAKWGPPLVKEFTNNHPESVRQRQILNKMTEELRRHAIAQALGQSPSGRWHPDSLTEITEDRRFSSSSSELSEIEPMTAEGSNHSEVTGKPDSDSGGRTINF